MNSTDAGAETAAETGATETDGAGTTSSDGDTGSDGEIGTDDGGYVHDPAAFDEDGERVDRGATGRTAAPGAGGADSEFDWRGWVLLGVVFVAFVIAPLVVYLRPPALPWWVALVIMPLAPAILLGATAVWATARA